VAGKGMREHTSCRIELCTPFRATLTRFSATNSLSICFIRTYARTKEQNFAGHENFAKASRAPLMRNANWLRNVIAIGARFVRGPAFRD